MAWCDMRALPVRLCFRFAQATLDTTLRCCARAVARAQMLIRTSRVRSIDAFKMIERQDFRAQAQLVFILRCQQASRLRKRQTGVYPDLGSSLIVACRFDHGAGPCLPSGRFTSGSGMRLYEFLISTHTRSRACQRILLRKLGCVSTTQVQSASSTTPVGIYSGLPAISPSTICGSRTGASFRRLRSRPYCISLMMNRTRSRRRIDRSELRLLVDVIAGLPARQRQILLMSRLESKTHSVIADHFDVSTRTVEFELKRALSACHALRRK